MDQIDANGLKPKVDAPSKVSVTRLNGTCGSSRDWMVDGSVAFDPGCLAWPQNVRTEIQRMAPLEDPHSEKESWREWDNYIVVSGRPTGQSDMCEGGRKVSNEEIIRRYKKSMHRLSLQLCLEGNPSVTSVTVLLNPLALFLSPQ